MPQRAGVGKGVFEYATRLAERRANGGAHLRRGERLAPGVEIRRARAARDGCLDRGLDGARFGLQTSE